MSVSSRKWGRRSHVGDIEAKVHVIAHINFINYSCLNGLNILPGTIFGPKYSPRETIRVEEGGGGNIRAEYSPPKNLNLTLRAAVLFLFINLRFRDQFKVNIESEITLKGSKR